MFNLFGGVKDKRFISKAVPLVILGMAFYYLFAVLTGEQINLLTTSLISDTGWDITVITSTITYGSLLAVPLVYIVNTLFMKVNGKRVIVGAVVLIAITVALIGLSDKIGSAALFIIAFLIMRIMTVIIEQGAQNMCNNWWAKNRGKALGIITIGAPLASATFVAISKLGINGGLKFSGTYFVFGVIILIIAVLIGIFYTNSPSDVGLYPDGELTEIIPQHENIEKPMSIKEILSKADAWMLIISYGILYFGITCITAFFVPAMTMNGVSASLYLSSLAVGAIVGIPISYLLGVIDDKYGTPKASLCMCVLYIIGFLGMGLTRGNTVVTVIMATIGYAGITGGCPNLRPSINVYVFGRKNFLAVTRILFAIQGVIAAFASMYMGKFIAAGNINMAYFVLVGAVIIAAILLIILGRKPAYDERNK